MSRRPHTFCVVLIAVMLAAISSGVNAASQGKQSGGTSGGGTTTTVHPALQQCKGPTNQCGKPTGLKCQIVTVMHCRQRCVPIKQKQCTKF